MPDMMDFPDTVEEFMEQYKVTDTKQIYSNGTEYVPIFRMKQWFEHIHAAPVVRCKNCVHWEGDPDTYSDDDGVKGFCMKSFERASEDDFCSHGERKTNGLK